MSLATSDAFMRNPKSFHSSPYRAATTDLERQNMRFVDHPSGISGDCWRVCLAIMLNVPWYTVEHFVYLSEITPDYNWWDRSVQWVQRKAHGWNIVELDVVFPVYAEPEKAPGKVILVGLSPRGDFDHAVIADAVTGDILWDPHPSRDGLVTRTAVYALIQDPIEEESAA